MQDQRIFDSIIRPLARRLNLAVWLNQALGLAIWVFGLFATVLLLLKLSSPELAPWSLLALVLFPAALVYAWMDCRKRNAFFRPAEVAEVVDHLYRNDGSISAAFEEPSRVRDAAFAARLASEIRPRQPVLSPRHYARRLAPIVLYAAVCLLIPPRPTQAAARGEALVQSMTQPLEEKVDEFSPLLPEQKAEELRENIEQIRKEDTEVSRQKWESIEALEKRIDQAVEASKNDLSPVLTSMQSLSSSQSSLSSNAPGGDQKTMEMLKSLNASLNDPNLQLSTALRGDLSKMAGQLGAGNFDKAAMDRKLEELRKMAQGKGKGEGKGSQPGEGAGDKGQGGSGKEGKGPDGDGDPGSGGVSRGRGDAVLTIGDPKEATGAKFERKELANQFLAPEDLVDMGITPLAPKADPGQYDAGSSRQFADQQGSAVSRTRISPSQRRVVEQYFSETSK